jgi:cell wall-associated NlpC family hydrolase
MHEEIVARARSLVGRSEYILRAEPQDAPNIVNCSVMMWWVFAQSGIHLPRYAMEQYKLTVPVHPDDIRPCDLVFMIGTGKQRRIGHEGDPVGHVGMLTASNQFVHAANSMLGVIEVPLSNIPAERLVAYGRVPALL